jgi:hypothetical protein
MIWQDKHHFIRLSSQFGRINCTKSAKQDEM